MVITYYKEIEAYTNDDTSLSQIQQIYMIVLQKCEKILKKDPSSKVLALVMAQLYINKIGNTAQGLSILTSLGQGIISIPARRSIESVMSKLEKVYSKSSEKEENKFEAIKYFEDRDSANKLKDNIRKEIKYHIAFWKQMTCEKIDVKTVVDIALKSERLSKKIKTMWATSSQEINRSFAALFLMYGIYLETIGGELQESLTLIKKFQSLQGNKSIDAKTANSTFKP